MTAPTVLEMMQAIEVRLQTIEGLRTAHFNSDQVNPPMAVVGVPPIESYRQAFGRATYALNFEVYILVSAALDRVGQSALAGYANPTGATSIVAAIEGDRTLGGLVQECVVDTFRPLGWEEVGAIGYYGGVFNLRVFASGA